MKKIKPKYCERVECKREINDRIAMKGKDNKNYCPTCYIILEKIQN